MPLMTGITSAAVCCRDVSRRSVSDNAKLADNLMRIFPRDSDTWADPDGGTGGTCPLQTNGQQKWSDRVDFVSLAS